MPAKETYGRFYIHTQLDGQHFDDTRVKKGTGEKRYKDVTMCEVCVMGSKNHDSRSFRVFEDDEETPRLYDGETLMDRYPRAWAAFKHDEGFELEGEPLRVLGNIGPSQVINLEAMGIESVEQLAELSDAAVIGEPGMLDLRKSAQAYLAAKNPERELAEKEAQRAEIDDLKRQLADMQEAIQQQTPKRRKRSAA